jgi:hypothetical protein
MVVTYIIMACSDLSHHTIGLLRGRVVRERVNRHIPAVVLSGHGVPGYRRTLIAKPNCVGRFLSYSVQYNLHDTAEKQDKIQYSGHPPLVVEAVGLEKAAERRR